MRIGVPTEIKVDEFRVGLVPSSVRELVAHGHEVIVQAGAGDGIFTEDEIYAKAGARIAATAGDVFAEAQMIVKVKEPQAAEWKRLKPEQILFTYLHLAPDAPQAIGLMRSEGSAAIAYETVTDDEWWPAAACTNERSRRAAFRSKLLHLASALAQPAVAACVAGRRARRSVGEGRCTRRRGCRYACGEDGGRTLALT